MSALHKNIRRIYALQVMQTALLGIAVIVPFVQENGVSLQQFFLLEAIFSATMFLTEIPTGYVADRWGRKNCLLLAAVFSIVGTSIFAAGTNFWHFLIAEMFFAIFITLNSGAMEALTYETLLAIGKADTSRNVFSKQVFLHMSTHAIASALGGLIAAYISLRTAMWGTLPFMLIGLIITCQLREPDRMILHKTHMRALHDIFKDTLLTNSPLRCQIILYALIASMTMALVWLSQMYQEAIHLPLAFFGVIHGSMILGVAIAAVLMVHYTKRAEDKALFIVISTIVVGSYILLGFTTAAWGLIPLFFGRSMWGALLPLSDDIVNRLTHSSIRATVLSIRTFIMRALYAGILPFIGYFAERSSLHHTLLWIGIAGGVLISASMIAMKNTWAHLPMKDDH